MKFNSHR